MSCTFPSKTLILSFQTCSAIYESLTSGDYGPVEPSMLETYRQQCQQLWPHANLFQSTIPQANASPPSYSSVSSPPPPYSACDTETDSGKSETTAGNQQWCIRSSFISLSLFAFTDRCIRTFHPSSSSYPRFSLFFFEKELLGKRNSQHPIAVMIRKRSLEKRCVSLFVVCCRSMLLLFK